MASIVLKLISKMFLLLCFARACLASHIELGSLFFTMLSCITPNFIHWPANVTNLFQHHSLGFDLKLAHPNLVSIACLSFSAAAQIVCSALLGQYLLRLRKFTSQNSVLLKHGNSPCNCCSSLAFSCYAEESSTNLRTSFSCCSLFCRKSSQTFNSLHQWLICLKRKGCFVASQTLLEAVLTDSSLSFCILEQVLKNRLISFWRRRLRETFALLSLVLSPWIMLHRLTPAESSAQK